MMTNLTREEREAYERYIFIKGILDEKKDTKGLEILNELIIKVVEYVQIVVNMETQLTIMRHTTDDPEKYSKGRENLDRNRGIKHNAMMSQITILNRYLFNRYGFQSKNGEIPPGGIFSLSPTLLGNMERNRDKIGDWAGYLVKALYKNKIIKRK